MNLARKYLNLAGFGGDGCLLALVCESGGGISLALLTVGNGGSLVALGLLQGSACGFAVLEHLSLLSEVLLEKIHHRHHKSILEHIR